MLNENIIINRLKNGDTASFKHIVDEYKDVSFSLAFSIVKDDVIAEDVLQESFLKVYRNIHKFKGKSSFATWLYRIVVNTSNSMLKKGSHNSASESDIDTENPYSFINEFETKDLAVIVKKAMIMLKPDEALILLLFYISELSINEIIQVTKFKNSKVKGTLHRGRENLRTILQNYLGEEIEWLL